MNPKLANSPENDILPDQAQISPTNVPETPKQFFNPILLTFGIILIVGIGLAILAFKPEMVGLTKIKPPVTVYLPTVQPEKALVPTTVLHSDWLSYVDDKAGFRLQYPSLTLVNAEVKGAKQPVLNISIEKLSDIPVDLPMDTGRDAALADKLALNQGKLTHPGFSLKNELIPLGKINGRLSTTLQAFEV
jgi:hypothetical protein